MENNNRYSKYLAVIALLISVVGVSLGFAAYTNTVNIQAAADVDYDNVPYDAGELSTNPTTQTDGPVTPTTEGGATAENASLNENGISNIKVHFTDVDQSATYTFYGLNSSPWTAFLNSVVFGTKTCTARTGTNQTYVDDACNDINMTITVGGVDFLDPGNTDINGHSVAAGNNEVIAVTIEYAAGGAVADGPFDVSFGTSTISYGSAD